jgi:RNase H-fold protein (predicted Holliday junction resolvase)
LIEEGKIEEAKKLADQIGTIFKDKKFQNLTQEQIDEINANPILKKYIEKNQ